MRIFVVKSCRNGRYLVIFVSRWRKNCSSIERNLEPRSIPLHPDRGTRERIERQRDETVVKVARKISPGGWVNQQQEGGTGRARAKVVHPQVLFPAGGNPFGVIIGNDTPERRPSRCVLERMVMMERCILTMFVTRGSVHRLGMVARVRRFPFFRIFSSVRAPIYRDGNSPYEK